MPRSAAEWSTRGALAIAVAIIGWFAVAHTLAQVVGTSDPARAYQLAPWDGRNTAAFAEARVLAGNADQEGTSALARTALRQDPTAVAAAATLAINAKLTGQNPRSDRLFAYAERLSRRNLASQLWAIENAVGRGDVAGALNHYDITFRTTEKGPDLLFPVLGQAISDPTIRAALTKMLVRRPMWANNFIGYLAASGPDLLATAQLFDGLRQVHVPIAPLAQAQLVGKLVTSNRRDEAWNEYTATRPGSERQRSRDAHFVEALASDIPSDFDWVIGIAPGITASIQRAGKVGLLDFATSTNVAGVLVQQLELLPPGNYQLTGHSANLDQPEASRPYWTLQCRPDGRDLGRAIVSNSRENGGIFAGSFSVPSGCLMQMLSLNVQSTDKIAGVVGQIDRVELVRTER
jgi:hypothetical protein